MKYQINLQPRGGKTSIRVKRRRSKFLPSLFEVEISSKKRGRSSKHRFRRSKDNGRNKSGSGFFVILTALSLSIWLAGAPATPLSALTDDEYSSRQYLLEEMGFPYAWEHELDGNGVTVAIIDSGLIAEHEDLNNDNLLPGKNYTGTGSSATTTDRLGHGTYVTGMLIATPNNSLGITGLTASAQVLPLKCFDVNTQTNVPAITQALNDAIASGCSVINMSFGFGNLPGQDITDFEAALEIAAQNNIIMVAPVGTSEHLEALLPAAHQTVVGVGAINSNGQATTYSQVDSSVFVTAPGEDIVSLWYTGSGDYKANETGTSYAAVFVTALAIMAKDYNPDISPDQFKSLLASSAEDLGNPGYDPVFGFGRIDAARFVDELIRTNGGTENLQIDIETINQTIAGCDLASYLPETTESGYEPETETYQSTTQGDSDIETQTSNLSPGELSEPEENHTIETNPREQISGVGMISRSLIIIACGLLILAVSVISEK